MPGYKLRGTDSAGTQFQLGAADEAIKALALLNSVEQKQLPVRDIVIEAPDGRTIFPAELKRLAIEEVHALALERAGRTHVPGRPPGQ